MPSFGLTPRDAAWLVTRRAQERSAAEQAALDQLTRLAAELEGVVALGERGLKLLRQRQGDRACEQWVTDAAASGVPELRGFAVKLTEDLSAVRAACREVRSNKLKLLRRSIYGRPKSDLLQLRLLRAA